MPSTYSPDLRIQLIANGEKTGTWGTITNENLGTLVEDAISGVANVLVTADKQALTIQDGTYDEARNAVVRLTASYGGDFQVFVPPVTKSYVFINASAHVATICTSSVAGNTTILGPTVDVPVGKSVLVRCSGSGIYEQLNYVAGQFGFGSPVIMGDTLTVVGSAILGGIPTADTAPRGTSTTQLATTDFVESTYAPFESPSFGITRIVTISIASPAVVSISVAPLAGATVTFSTTGTLPTGLSLGTLYYVLSADRTDTSFKISTTLEGTPVITTASGTGIQSVTTVPVAPTADVASDSVQIATTEFVKNITGTIGTMAAQNADAVAITGGTIAGMTSIADTAGNVRALPINDKTASYVLLVTDAGKVISITTGGITLNSGIFTAGQTISIYNNSGVAQTITQGAGVTMRLVTSGLTGNRTLGIYGLCTILCIASNSFVITGAGVS